MSQSAKVQEPSMEEILDSIRRIIADDEKPAPKPPAPPVAVAPPPPPRPAPVPSAPPPRPVVSAPPPMNQNDVDAMMASLDAPPGAPPEPQEDVLDLTESMATSGTSNPSFQTIDGQPDVIFSDAPPSPEPPPPPRAYASAPPLPQQAAAPTPTPTPTPTLLSNTASAAVDSAFNALAQTVLVQNARTLEDLVREMLRPMLKSWLDDNLPSMVERIVRAEIERVSRGR